MKKLIIFLLTLVLPLSCCSIFKPQPPCVSQTLENVVSIELLDTDNYEENVLYTLTENEFADFWIQFTNLEFTRLINDPPTYFGKLAVKITYADGGSDIFGIRINDCKDAKGNSIRTGWYSLINDEDYISLFSQYIDPSLLPEPS